MDARNSVIHCSWSYALFKPLLNPPQIELTIEHMESLYKLLSAKAITSNNSVFSIDLAYLESSYVFKSESKQDDCMNTQRKERYTETVK